MDNITRIIFTNFTYCENAVPESTIFSQVQNSFPVSYKYESFKKEFNPKLFSSLLEEISQKKENNYLLKL